MSSFLSTLSTLGHTRTADLLEVYPMGHLIKRKQIGFIRHIPPSNYKPRGPITKLSRKAAARLRQRILMMRGDQPFLFVTLTYGVIFPGNCKDAKSHLNKLWRNLVKKFPSASCLWVMQFQQRGAIHFHILVWGVKDRTLRRWIKPVWNGIATDEGSFIDSANAHVGKGRSLKGAANYLSRPNAAPEAVLESGESIGRLWGEKNATLLPISPRQYYQVLEGKEAQIDRLFRRYIQAHSRFKKGRQTPNSIQLSSPSRWAHCLQKLGLIERWKGESLEKGTPKLNHSLDRPAKPNKTKFGSNDVRVEAAISMAPNAP